MAALAVTSAMLKAFAESRKVTGETQLQRYTRLGASPEVLDIISMGGGPRMGTMCEDTLRRAFPALKPRESKKASGTSNTGYDQRIQVADGSWKKLEQKTSGLWSAAENDFKWQHIETEHPWHGLLLVGIQLHGLSVWGMNRADFERMVATGKATNQGSSGTQGYWMTYKNVKEACQPITTEAELLAFAGAIDAP